MQNFKSFICVSLFFTSLYSYSEDNSCDTNFQETYLAKHSCVFNNDQEGCYKFGVRSALLPLTTAGAAAAGAAGAAKMYTSLLQKKFGSPEKMKAAMQEMKRALQASDRAAELEAENGSTATAEKMVFGQAFKNRTERNKFIIQKVKPGADPDMDLIKLQKEDPAAYERAKALLDQFKETHKNTLLSQTDDPYVRATIQRRMGNIEAPLDTPVKLALKKFFSAHDVDQLSEKSIGKYTPEWKQLTPTQKFIYEMLQPQNNQPYLLEEGFGPYLIKESAEALTAKTATTAKVSAAVAAALAGLPEAADAGIRAVDRSKIKSCKKSLNLTDAEVEQLMNDYQWIGNIQTKSDTFDWNCDHLRLRNPEQTLMQAKYLNQGKIPAGICKIMKNEMSRMEQVLGQESPPSTADCDGLKAPNVKISGPAEHRQFEYNDGNHIYKTEWNSTSNYPELRHVKIFGADGKEDRVAELNFSPRYLAKHRASDVLDKNPGQEDIEACAAASESSLDCGLVHAALKARVYSALSTAHCSTTQEASHGTSFQGHFTPSNGSR